MKSGKNKDYANNVAVVNKDRNKNRQEDDSNVEYIDEELGNFTEDNLEDDVEEEGMKCKNKIDFPLVYKILLLYFRRNLKTIIIDRFIYKYIVQT